MGKRLAIVPAVFLVFMSVIAGSLGISDFYREEGSRIINEWFLMYDMEMLDLEEMDPEYAESSKIFPQADEPDTVDPELVQSGIVYSGVIDSDLTETENVDPQMPASGEETSEAAYAEDLDSESGYESQEVPSSIQDAVTPPDWSWEQAHRYLWLAYRLTPFDPTVLEELGRIHQYGVKRYDEDASYRDPDRKKALAFFRQSLALRPAWPYGWMGIMLVKLKDNNLDKDFVTAMKRAAQLGPWEPGIQMGIAEDGLAAQDRLPEDLRRLVMATVEKGVQRESEYIIAVAEEYGLIEPRVEVSHEIENAAK